jgi:parallel beta-helix repeat protein
MKKKFVKIKILFVILFLLICINIFPSIAKLNEETAPLSSINSSILYVGGSGQGNYTHIQDAIDDASDGDTVFVYNGTYVENLIVNKSINLIGEDKNTTIIDGSQGTSISNVVLIKDANSVTICGFTFGYGIFYGSIIKIDTNYNIITNNVIGPINESIAINILGDYNVISNNTIKNYNGIFIFSDHNILSGNTIEIDEIHAIAIEGRYNLITENNIRSYSLDGIELGGFGNNNITQNIISNCPWTGISISQSNDNYIAYNVICSNEAYGIANYRWSLNNTIKKNTISNNDCGIYVDESTSIYGNNISHNVEGIVFTASDTLISLNTITYNTVGIKANSNKNNLIFKNNFIKNKDDARYRYSMRDLLLGKLLFGENEWNANFWNNPQLEPVPIKGRIGGFLFRFIPWFPQYDNNPAQEPYELE